MHGLMFSDRMFNGEPMTSEYATKRARREPMHEVTQIKGHGESLPFLSPDDEFADFETWDVGNLAVSAAKTPEKLKYEYARSALKLGLKLGRDLGVNALSSRCMAQQIHMPRSPRRAETATLASSSKPSRHQTGTIWMLSQLMIQRCAL
jgi:hypothetical protein